MSLTPDGPGPGRFWKHMRTGWALQVLSALDDAAAWRAAAQAASSFGDAEYVKGMLVKAYSLATTGVTDGVGVGRMGSADEAFAEWSRASGIDHKDPEQLKKVYQAVAEINRARQERMARGTGASPLRPAAQPPSRGDRTSGRPGKIPRPPR